MIWHAIQDGLPPVGRPVLVRWKTAPVQVRRSAGMLTLKGGREGLALVRRVDPALLGILWWDPVGFSGSEWDWDFQPKDVTYWADVAEEVTLG